MTKRVTPLFAVVALGLGGGIASAEQAPAPRTLPSGAPACGNAQSKSPCTTTTTTTVVKRDPNGASACVDVLDTVNGNSRDPIYVSCVRGEPQGVELRNKMVVAKVFTLLGLSTASLKIAPARPRELRTGSPAPGNVARRSSGRAEQPRNDQQAAREIHND